MVAGGAGFLGSHLCERLLAEGAEVLCVDNFHTSFPSNVAHLEGERFTLLEHDVTTPFDADADVVFNLACPASPVQYKKEPVTTTMTSVVGTANTLELATRNEAVMVLASTSEVYGDPQVHPQPESYWGNVNPIGPRACYDEGKRCAETLCFDYRRQHGTRIKVARIFNTYGPGMLPDDGRVVSTFIMRALRGEPLTIFGDGEQTRSFCYVDDMVAALIRLANTGDDVTGPINLGSAVEITMRHLAERIIALSGSRSELVFEPSSQDDPTRRRPDLSLSDRVLSWEPTTSLDEGLRATIAFFEEGLTS